MGSTWTPRFWEVFSKDMVSTASKTEAPLVSIIVPMYNVGKFALPCTRSLLCQTYPNIEILIVDDGCTDGTIDLIEGVVGDDPRVEILHKENGGLSSARNYGTRRCHGDYLMYVDGDDLIDPRAVEFMVQAALRYRVSFVAGSFAKTPPLESYEMRGEPSFTLESGREHLRRFLLLDGESGSAWGKLFARSLVPFLIYPEGQLFEDMGVTSVVCSRVETIAVTDAPFYAYVTRPGSITTLKRQGPKHVRDMVAAIEAVRQVAEGDFEGEFECFRAYCILRVAMRVDLDAFADRTEGQAYLRYARDLARHASRSPLASRTWRLRCALFALSPKTHNVFYALYAAVSGKAIG